MSLNCHGTLKVILPLSLRKQVNVKFLVSLNRLPCILLSNSFELNNSNSIVKFLQFNFHSALKLLPRKTIKCLSFTRLQSRSQTRFIWRQIQEKARTTFVAYKSFVRGSSWYSCYCSTAMELRLLLTFKKQVEFLPLNTHSALKRFRDSET